MLLANCYKLLFFTPKCNRVYLKVHFKTVYLQLLILMVKTIS